MLPFFFLLFFISFLLEKNKKMLSVNSDAALITGIPLITVNTKSIRSEVRASDSGLNMKLYAVNLKHIYYMVRFCTINSYHSVTGRFYLTLLRVKLYVETIYIYSAH